MSSEPPEMDIIASGDHRESESGWKEEAETAGLSQMLYCRPL